MRRRAGERPRLPLVRRLAFRIGAPITLVGVVVAVSMTLFAVAIEHQRDSAEVERHTEDVVELADEMERMLVDAQAAVRGYVATGEDGLLAPWREARTTYRLAAERLVAMLGGEAEVRRLAEEVLASGHTYLEQDTREIVELAADDPAAARRRVADARDERLADLRDVIRALVEAEQQRADALTAEADRDADRAILFGILAGITGVAALVGLTAYLSSQVAAPIRRTALAAQRIAEGDLHVRVGLNRADELGHLARAFDAMGQALADNAAELESQHAELESQNLQLEGQTVELERQATELERREHELTRANEDLRLKQEELQETSTSLAVLNERLRVLADVQAALERRPGLRDRAMTALAAVADVTGAEIGALYVRAPGEDGDDGDLALLATRGIAADDLPSRLRPSEGLAGRAVRERRIVAAAHGDGRLRLRAFGREVPVGQELHVPLRYGETTLGVMSLGRVNATPFTDDEHELVKRLSEHAAVALDNSLAARRARRLLDINRGILDAVRDGILLVDPDGREVVCNPAMARKAADLFGLDRSEVATLAANASAVAERTRDPLAYRRRMTEILADPTSEDVDEFELASGRWLHRYTGPVHASDGSLLGRLVVLRETTAQHEAAKLKDDLVSTVSHELRTPLAAILGFAELLLVREFSAEDRASHLRMIHEQAERLSELIDDLLDLQRLQRHDSALVFEPIDARDVLRGVVELYAGQSEAHAVELELPDAPLAVRADAAALSRAVGNLVSNAIKYSPDGGAVEVRAELRDGEVKIAVRDEGLGIPADAREHVFERFFRVDSSATRRIGGTGLGLALVREIAEAHDGRVAVESVEGEGSTFTIALPVDGGALAERGGREAVSDGQPGPAS